MERFCQDLKEHATEMINYEKTEMIPLTVKESKSHHKQKICYIFKKGFSIDDNKKQIIDLCHYTGKYRGATYNLCNLRYKITKEIPVIFHNGSRYDYNFIIKEVTK